MQQHGMSEEMTASVTVTVLPTDTLLCALRVMKEHQLRLLPVVEETGALLGLISEAHILEAWEDDPLLLVSEVMAGCGLPEEEEEPWEGIRLPLAVGWEWAEQPSSN
ncbi:CBS domain-containing protein [Hyalangium gracile]|uniref:CBS domain-containing protein n=1 Tax=Hyalangium gracile TaxID=394092 RepID=UPI001CCC673D|nr:CBS domain-containing protein [Hyalangium gracile]